MKPREIFLNALDRLPVTRPAVGSATSIVTIDLMQAVGQFFPEAHLSPAAMADLAEAGHSVLGFDNVMPLFGVWHESAALGCPVHWGAADRMPDGQAILGDVSELPGIPDGWLERPSCQVPLEAIAILKKRLGDEVAVVGKVFGPWTLGYHLYGVGPFLMGTMTNPDGVRRVLDVLKQVTIQFARAQMAAGADAITLADHATRDLCSPETYRDFLLDIHRELAAEIDCPLILHICGDTADRIQYIRESGLACFHFDSKVPAHTARQLAGKKTCAARRDQQYSGYSQRHAGDGPPRREGKTGGGDRYPRPRMRGAA
ncbi:MAG: MtaA/CmuA family methyltransferase [Candidatus Omnitrophica bacterium]|nr:MtaA/CmuA family methyltransferase [Candidatus Omnitrophota bacterium]